MSEIILEKRYPHSRSEDITDAFMRGYVKGKADRPQGKWIDVWQDGICSWRGTCSVCRSTNDIPPPFEANFCPNCGAHMKGATDGNK